MAIVLVALTACAAEGSVSQDGEFPADCETGDASEERWGTDCLCCHDDQFSMAGSVSLPTDVAEIRVSDGINQAIAAPNSFGNFFRHVKLTPPLSASLVFADGHEVKMRDPAPDGACNRCHDGVERPLLGELR